MHKEYLARVAEASARMDIGEIENAVRIIQEVKNSGNIVWIVGNGGSASTAEHFANDLVKMAYVRAIALPSLMPSVLAFGNDQGWERMYRDLISILSRKEGDVLVAISCGGNSPNVLNAAAVFYHSRLIVLTGNNPDSSLAKINADAKIFVPDGDIRIQEDIHLSICHIIAGAVK